jgi:formylglycine-generating enzyme required for sulfatase activity
MRHPGCSPRRVSRPRSRCLSAPQTPSLAPAGGEAYPVVDIEWSEARAYCRFLGKRLPIDREWEKAKRGGSELDGKPNPRPRRNLPWPDNLAEIPANLDDTGIIGPAPVGTSPGDVSPYGVLDLAGNVQEWTGSETKHGFVVTRGCNWTKCNTENLVRFMAIGNERGRRYHNFDLGMRCALAPAQGVRRAPWYDR